MTDRITPQELAMIKAVRDVDYIPRLIREVSLLTEERDAARHGLADQITARKASDLEADTILMSNGALTEETLRLRAEIEKLRAALREIVDAVGQQTRPTRSPGAIARAALGDEI